MSTLLRHWCGIAVFLAAGLLARAETLPPPPTAYFNDYARVVAPAAAQALNARLAQFERDTSNQIVVAVFPRMDSSSSIEDYTVRVAQSWKVGQKGRDNGAVLFVFIASRQLYIQVGYGLEGALPDATCRTIIDREIKPRFRAGDYGGGLDAAVTAMIAAAKGEYHGTGRTQADTRNANTGSFSNAVSALIIPFIFLIILIRIFGGMTNRGRTYGRSSGGSGWWVGGGGGGFGGGSSGGGGGGFSGGGGSFGGGGSGGSW